MFTTVLVWLSDCRYLFGSGADVVFLFVFSMCSSRFV